MVDVPFSFIIITSNTTSSNVWIYITKTSDRDNTQYVATDMRSAASQSHDRNDAMIQSHMSDSWNVRRETFVLLVTAMYKLGRNDMFRSDNQLIHVCQQNSPLAPFVIRKH